MRFSSIHKLTSYLMVLAAVAALLLSPEVSRVVAIIVLAGIALSWFAEPSRLQLGRFTAAWNVATVACFFFLLTDVLRERGGNVITSGSYFLLFVLINKLFNRRTSKDYLQAYVISFLILVVATTLNTNLSYAACFALYILFATWTFTLLHLRREMEENYLLKHADGLQSEKVEVERILNSRRIVGGSFLAGTSLVSIGILLGAVAVFVLFPRIGFGLFLGIKRGGVAMVGFSERVQLGHHGVVRNNPNVVMRVLFPDGRPKGPLRWRGSVYDHYDSGTWSHGPDLIGRKQPLTPVSNLYLVNYAPGLPVDLTPSFVRSRLTAQEIYLEPLDTTVIFAADRPVAVEVPKPLVGNKPFFIPRRGPLGEIRGDKMRTAGVRYFAFSQIYAPPSAMLRRSELINDPRWSRHLQVPSSLPARVGQLARQITRGKQTVFDKVIAVQRFLQRNYRYTLNLTHDPQLEPVDEFLFVTKRGHCEYFASAMALMLRYLGIHARNVNGFAGGEWNELGKYVAVRQGDAHAWVEVLFSDVGWVTFDPTPSGAAPSSTPKSGLSTKLSQFLDTLRLRWFRYVVEYDLGKQVSLFRGAKDLFRSAPDQQGWWAQNWRKVLVTGGAILLAVAAALIWLRRRRRYGGFAGHQRRGRLPPPAALYKQLLSTLARVGHVKEPGTTPREFVTQLTAGGFGPVLLVERFTDCYYKTRYGNEAFDSEQLQTLLKSLQHKLEAER